MTTWCRWQSTRQLGFAVRQPHSLKEEGPLARPLVDLSPRGEVKSPGSGVLGWARDLAAILLHLIDEAPIARFLR